MLKNFILSIPNPMTGGQKYKECKHYISHDSAYYVLREKAIIRFVLLLLSSTDSHGQDVRFLSEQWENCTLYSEDFYLPCPICPNPNTDPREDLNMAHTCEALQRESKSVFPDREEIDCCIDWAVNTHMLQPLDLDKKRKFLASFRETPE